MQGLLDGNDCSWTAAPEVGGRGTLDFKGEFLHPGGFASYPGVIGVPRKAESLEGATLVLLQQGLAGPHADRVRTACDGRFRGCCNGTPSAVPRPA